jgi:hypothetical protein
MGQRRNPTDGRADNPVVWGQAPSSTQKGWPILLACCARRRAARLCVQAHDIPYTLRRAERAEERKVEVRDGG